MMYPGHRARVLQGDAEYTGVFRDCKLEVDRGRDRNVRSCLAIVSITREALGQKLEREPAEHESDQTRQQE